MTQSISTIFQKKEKKKKAKIATPQSQLTIGTADALK